MSIEPPADSALPVPPEGEPHKRKYAYFSTGPDKYLRKCRPYFWVPLNMRPERTPEIPIPYADAVEEVTQWLHRKDAQGQDQQPTITDVFVISHGWHRNLFSAAAAYDRLLGRFINLTHTGRLRPQRPFVPLFLTLHWHSDPGADAWLDKCGRRHKASFMRNAAEYFELDDKHAPGAQFTRDFEQLFNLLSKMSSTPEDPASMVNKTRLQQGLLSLDNYRMKEQVVPLERSEKVTLLWMCYHEATAHGPLLPQTESPEKVYFTAWQAVQTAGKFLIGALGIAAVAAAFLGQFRDITDHIWNRFHHKAAELLGTTGGFGASLFTWVLICAVFLLGLVVTLPLFYLTTPDRPLHTYEWNDEATVAAGGPATAPTSEAKNQKTRRSRGFPALLVILWLHVQLCLTVPFVLVSLITYLIGGVGPKTSKPSPNDERLGDRGSAPPAIDCTTPGAGPRPPRGVRSALARLARWPIRRLQHSVSPDSFLLPLADTIDSQLAFYEMQFYGVISGAQAAQAMVSLVEADAAAANNAAGKLAQARFHFVGHSFGCLVVANAVRHLAYDNRFKQPIQTLAFLQAAVGSDWFYREDQLIAKVRGNIACVFSRYDTATGFYYPLSSNARMGAGNVGLAHGPAQLPAGVSYDDPRSVGSKLPKLVMLVDPPRLNLPPGQNIVNLDASRIVHEGAVASGGGHDDIFKDDLLHLLWSVCDL